MIDKNSMPRLDFCFNAILSRCIQWLLSNLVSSNEKIHIDSGRNTSQIHVITEMFCKCNKLKKARLAFVLNPCSNLKLIPVCRYEFLQLAVVCLHERDKREKNGGVGWGGDELPHTAQR